MSYQERQVVCMSGAILFISPRHADAGTLAAMLQSTALRLDHAHGIQEARDRLSRDSYGAILVEAQLPDGDWTDALKLTHEMGVFPAVVVTGRLADDRFWAEVLNLGAYDLLAQPFEEGEVRRILAHACSQACTKPVRNDCGKGKSLPQAM
jgi:DNA-binding NtrC family response regulator